MDHSTHFQKLCQIEAKRYILLVGLLGVTYLMLQTLALPYGKTLKSLLPENEALLGVNIDFPSNDLASESVKEVDTNSGSFVGSTKKDEQSNGKEFVGGGDRAEKADINIEVVELEGEVGQAKYIGHENDERNRTVTEVEARALSSMIPAAGKIKDNGNKSGISGPEFVDQVQENSSISDLDNSVHIEQFVGNEDETSSGISLEPSKNLSSDCKEDDRECNRANIVIPEYIEDIPRNDVATLGDDVAVKGTRLKKKVKPGMPPISVVSIDKMNRILGRHLASSKKKTQWLSHHDRDKEILDAKWKIINSAASSIDKELYAPVFRNVSTFMRSYELMEQTVKVYIYKDGKKPIFHQPVLKGLYASEGWFMKLMERNKHFVVKNPAKAHLFYLPFSSRMLEYTLYIVNSHNRTNLREFVKNYTETIAAKYPFWNRTGGKDHFLVACHDWALYETRHHMENSIKALCNADVTIGFKIGRDVSLPETFIRYARNPLRNIGGKPPSKRNILAFYAGNSHGYLRPILLKHWKDKDPDMRIYGLLPTGVSRKMNYIQHMKSTKYCLCPKGFEVNSPRIIEAIYYECVPVIISDNFVPPLFEILNWEAFSVFVAEKDIPNLKDILLSIPEDKYFEMQLAVRKVQQHFLWHARPVKYDLFHMTLHSIWYSRVFQI